MKLDEFIKNVLTDIHNGMIMAKDNTDRKYYVNGNGERSGVNFDIAVVAVNSSSSQVEGQAKAGFIEVLGAKVGAKLDSKEENSQISRIKFNIDFPWDTIEETKKRTPQIL